MRQTFEMTCLAQDVIPINTLSIGADDQVALPVLASAQYGDARTPRIRPEVANTLVAVPFFDPAVGKSPITAMRTALQKVQSADRRLAARVIRHWKGVIDVCRHRPKSH